MWLKFLAGVSLLLVSSAPCVVAAQFRVGPVYTDQPGEVSVVVELPPGVTPEASDFRLMVDGEIVATAAEIKTFDISDGEVALVLCVDVSRTMSKGKKDDPLEDTRSSLATFLKDKARAGDHIALISFADKVEQLSSFEGTRDSLVVAVGKLYPNPKENQTRLYDALRKSLDTLQNAKLPGVKRRHVIVVSDGKDEGSTEDPESVIKASQDLGIPIDAVGRGRIDERYAESLRALSGPTGGHFAYAPPVPMAVNDKINQIYQDLLKAQVVYFRYQRDDAGQTTPNALIELQRTGEPSWWASLPEAIPLPPPSDVGWLRRVLLAARSRAGWIMGTLDKSPWLRLVLLALLGSGLIVLIYRLLHKEPEPAQRGKETPVSPPKQEIPSPPLRVPTVVGGYYFPVPGPEQPTAILTAVSGPLEGQQFSIKKEIFHIGVSPENDLCIAADDYVSENHASLRYEKGNLFIFDRGSKNGTFVNKNKVSDTGLALNLGDRIEVGMSTFEVARAPSSGRAETPVR